MKSQIPTRITEEIARKVSGLVALGLPAGLGRPKPGEMCIQAVVSNVMGQTHSDRPSCVNGIITQIGISLNDKPWSSRKARGKGLQRFAVAELGSNTIDGATFNREFDKELREIIPKVICAIANESTRTNQRVYAAIKNDLETGHYDAALMKAARMNSGCIIHNCLYQFVNAPSSMIHIHKEHLIGLHRHKTYDAILTGVANAAVRAMQTLKSPGTKYLSVIPEE